MVTLWCAAASGNGACSLLLHSPLSKDVQWKFHAWRRHRRQILNNYLCGLSIHLPSRLRQFAGVERLEKLGGSSCIATSGNPFLSHH